ncbi:hypothetical protein [Ralstonia pseudosolanacearum]|uniref:hypothetical protein n=1 Tax=Ralstonia pseudosolanacearum TaxID=1310165 RepID=UPI003F795F50
MQQRPIYDLKNSVKIAENEYKKAVESDPKSEVFGPVEKYQSGYTCEKIQALRKRRCCINPPRHAAS